MGDDRYAVHVRTADRRSAVDDRPHPSSFVASLASCVAHYAGGFLRANVCREGLRVDMTWQMSPDRPARVARFALQITPPHCRGNGSRPARGSPGLHGPQLARAAPDVCIEIAPV